MEHKKFITEEVVTDTDFVTDATGNLRKQQKQVIPTSYAIRQGNIGLIKTSQKIPEDAELITGKVVEDGKHLHTIASGKIYNFGKKWVIYGQSVFVEKFLEIPHTTILHHDQHGDAVLPEGNYAVIKERAVYKDDVVKAIKASLQGQRDAELEKQRLRYARE